MAELKEITNFLLPEFSDLKGFEREIMLKKFVGMKLSAALNSNTPLFNDLSLWVIEKWGGIRTKKKEETIFCVHDFLNSSKPPFKRIASTSKVGSFLYPKKNIIYDSRVIYTLNWILLSENAGDMFFPSPEGRNTKLLSFDMNVLINLKHVKNYLVRDIRDLDSKQFIKKKIKDIFIDENEAYPLLNSLMLEVSQKLWKGEVEKQKNLYYTEMLMFSIADREVFHDVTNRLSLHWD